MGGTITESSTDQSTTSNQKVAHAYPKTKLKLHEMGVINEIVALCGLVQYSVLRHTARQNTPRCEVCLDIMVDLASQDLHAL